MLYSRSTYASARAQPCFIIWYGGSRLAVCPLFSQPLAVVYVGFNYVLIICYGDTRLRYARHTFNRWLLFVGYPRVRPFIFVSGTLVFRLSPLENGYLSRAPIHSTCKWPTSPRYSHGKTGRDISHTSNYTLCLDLTITRKPSPWS